MEIVFIRAIYKRSKYSPDILTEVITLPDYCSPSTINKKLIAWSEDKGPGDYSWEYKEK